jgi:hypothetical protein
MSRPACPHVDPRSLLRITFDPVTLDWRRYMSPMKRAFRDDSNIPSFGGSSGTKMWTFGLLTSSQLGMAIVSCTDIPLVSYTDVIEILQVGVYITRLRGDQ